MTYNELAELFKREGGDAQVCFSVISQNQILFGNNDTKKGIIGFKNEEPIKWAKETQEESVNEDLENAANSYIDNWYKLNNLDKESYPIDVEISKNAFKAGAEWQKEQMMKEAVYGLVCGHDESSPAWIDLNLLNKPNIKVGTEVKLIIIKNE